MSLIRAELRKLLGLPAAWLGIVLGVLLGPVVVLLNAPSTRRAIAAGTAGSDVGLVELGVGLIGAMTLGVVIVSSEFTSTGDDSPDARQLMTTLLAVPHRLRLFAAKTVTLVLVAAILAGLTVAATLLLTRMLFGPDAVMPAPGRVAGAILYWVLTALMAYAITLITRNGIIPLTLLILNSTVVSLSYLLSRVITAAAYLPDIAGARMFLQGGDFPVALAPLTAGLVMSAWIAVLLLIAATVLHRRDA